MKSKHNWTSRISIVIICLFGSISGHSQSDPSTDLKRIVLPSPTASSLGQYGNTPVGLYTGSTQVDIPIYEIHEGALKLPISLAYHAGGFKLAEMASWVGLGWSLNAGGSITRTVYGQADENSINSFFTLTDNAPSRADIKKALLGQIDTQPDVFYFNFNGKSGKFFIGKSGVIPVSPHQNLKIQAYQGNDYIMDPPFIGLGAPLQFRITDEEGIVYEFRDYETNRTISFAGNGNEPDVNQQGNPQASITAWYLTRMYSPSGDTIRFVYTDYQLYYDMSSSEQRFVNMNESSVDPSWPSLVINITKNQNRNKRLSQILFSNGSLKFMVNSPRLDLVGDSVLDEVRLLDQNGFAIKRYELHYNETGQPAGTDDNNYNSYTAGVSMTSTHRLMLSSVDEKDGTGVAFGKKYRFDYNSSGSTPSRFSRARDYWGYWNGGPDDMAHILDYQIIGSDPSNLGNYQLTNKEPNLDYCQAYSLSKITWPTGGYTQFNYELHDAYVGRSVLPPQLTPQNVSMPINFLDYGTLGYVDTVIAGRDCKYKPFTVHTGSGATPTITIAGMLYQSPQIVMKFDIYTSDNQLILSMRDIVDDQLTQTTINQTNQTVQYVLAHFFNDGNYKMLFTPIPVYIGSSNYLNQYGANPNCTLSSWSNVLIHTDSVDISRSIGGLRIRSTVDYDPVTNKTVESDYSYKLQGSPLSSGNIVWAPNYIYSKVNVRIGTYGYVVLNGESNVPLSTTQGSNVGYSRVTVTKVDASAHTSAGMSEYFYSNAKNFPDSYGLIAYPPTTFPSEQTVVASVNIYGSGTHGPANPYPYVPADDRDWQRGLLLQQVDYTSSADGFMPIRYETHTYYPPVYVDTVIGMTARYDREAIPTITDTVYQIANGDAGTLYPAQEIYAIAPYGYTEGYMLPATKTETLIGDNGVSTTTTETYTYADAPNNLLPTSTTVTNSKGEVTTTHISYPFDYSVGISPSAVHAQGIADLQQRHMITPRIEIFVQRSNPDGSSLRTISGTYLSYKSDRPLLDSVFRLDISQPLSSYAPVSITSAGATMNPSFEPRLAFGSYDSRGNLLQQNKVNDMPHSYIWDYNGFYPVAEATNATTADISYTSFEADGSGGWNFNFPSRNTSDGVTGTCSYSLSSDISRGGLLPSTTYVVSYWSKSSTTPYFIAGTVSGYPLKGKTVSINGANWTYYEHKITGQSSITINGTGSIDELRLYPANATMTTSCFAPLIGMTNQCDINNRITYFQYDALSRLQTVKDQDGNIIKTIDYHYKGQ